MFFGLGFSLCPFVFLCALCGWAFALNRRKSVSICGSLFLLLSPVQRFTDWPAPTPSRHAKPPVRLPGRTHTGLADRVLGRAYKHSRYLQQKRQQPVGKWGQIHSGQRKPCTSFRRDLHTLPGGKANFGHRPEVCPMGGGDWLSTKCSALGGL